MSRTQSTMIALGSVAPAFELADVVSGKAVGRDDVFAMSWEDDRSDAANKMSGGGTSPAGRHGLLFARDTEGWIVRMNIKRKEYAEDSGPIDASCGCMVCARYSRAYLRHLFVAGEPLGLTLNSLHNLHFYLATMERVRSELARD